MPTEAALRRAEVEKSQAEVEGRQASRRCGLWHSMQESTALQRAAEAEREATLRSRGKERAQSVRWRSSPAR